MPTDDSDQTGKGPGRRRSRRPPIFAIVLLGGFLLVALAFITFRQLRAGEQNRLRLLTGFAEQVETTVPDLVARYVNVIDRARTKEDVKRRLESVPNVRLAADPASPRDLHERDFEVIVAGSRIELVYVGKVPPDEKPSGGLYEYRGLLDVPAVVRPIVIPGIFDLIVLAERDPEKGTVLFQHGEPELKLAEAGAAWEVRRPGLMESLRNSWSDTATEEPSGGGTRVVETEIAGTDYRVFIQPVTIHLRDGEGNPLGEPQEWVACGIVSWERLLSSSFTTSPVLLFLMVSLLPLMLVSWPFLKMWLISRREPFTRFDVAALVFATLIGLALVTLVVLDMVFLVELRQEVDSQLDSLAVALDDSFETEIGDAARQLVELRDERVRSPAGPVSTPDEVPTLRKRFLWSDPSGPTREEWLPFRSVPAGRANWDAVYTTLPKGSITYPLLHSVFWTDADGLQESKIPFHEDALLQNSVRDRGYFRCQQPRFRRDDLPPGVAVISLPSSFPHGVRLCFESIRSKTTAEDLAVLSISARSRAGDSGTNGGDQHGEGVDAPRAGALSEPVPIFALVTRLASLTHPLLAPGFSFAVLDREGRVLFHADPRRNVTEDFLRATGENEVLAAMLREQRSGPLAINYWGTRYRAHVHPLESPPWSLVTLRSTRDLRTRNFELVYDFLNPFLLYAIGTILVLALAIPTLPRKCLQYFSPSRDFTPAYRLILLSAPLLIGLFSLLLVGGGPLRLALGAAALPGAGVAIAVAGFRRRTRWGDEAGDAAAGWRARISRGWREPGAAEWLLLVGGPAMTIPAVAQEAGVLSVALLVVALSTAAAYVLLRRAFIDRTTVAPYVAALSVMLSLTSVLPSMGFFRLAESRQAQILIQDTQVGLLRAADRRNDGLGFDRGPLRDDLPPYDVTLSRFREQAVSSFFDSALVFPKDASPKTFRKPLWPYQRSAGLGIARLLAARPVPLDDLTRDRTGTDLSRFGYHGATWKRAGDRLWAEWYEAPRIGIESPDDLANPRGIESRFTDLGLPRGLPPLRGILVGAGLLGVALLVVAAAWFLAKKVLVIDLAPNRRQAAIGEILWQLQTNGHRSQRILVLTSLPAAVEQMARGPQFADRFHVLRFARLWGSGEPSADETRERFMAPLEAEVRRLEEERRTGAAERSGGGTLRSLLITDFRPELNDPRVAERQIELLEELWSHGGERLRRSMVLVMSRPYHRLARPSRPAGGVIEPADADQEEARSKWGAFLARFGQRYARDDGRREMFAAWLGYQVRCLDPRPAGETGGEPWEAWRQEDLARTEPVWPATAQTVSGDRAPWEPPWYSARDEVVQPDEDALSTEEDVGRGHRKKARRLAHLLETVREECRWTWRLQRVGIDIVRELEKELLSGDDDARDRWNPPTGAQLIERIGFAAQPYYLRIWDRCELEEKLVLYQLARYGVVNPKSFDRVLDLLNKGLVIREPDDPVLRPMNRSFAAFVRRAVRRWEIWRWEDAEGISAWSVWKWVLPVPLLLLGAFLFITQQDAVSNVIGVVVAVAALLPTGINLYQHFRQLADEWEAGGG